VANLYARSSDGNNADNGTTWALAKATLAGAAAIDAAGDTIWLSQSHSETGATSYISPGTVAAPVLLLCGNDSAEPPTALATGASLASSANNAIGVTTGYSYVYGITMTAGASTGAADMNLTAAQLDMQQCTLRLGSTGNGKYTIGSASGRVRLTNCTMKFSAAGQTIQPSTAGASVEILGGGLESGTTSPTTLVTAMGAGAHIAFSGFDLSAAGSAMNLCDATAADAKACFRDCKMPASWSGSLHSGTPGNGSIFEMFNCDSADTHYTYRKHTQIGTVRDETTLVRTGGASDGATTYSYKLVSNANAEHPLLTLDAPEMVRWNDTVGSAITVTVEFLHDSVTNLTDKDIFLDVMYLGTSGVPLASFVSDGASVVATAADQAASSETWTTTGMTNPNKQKLSVTFTPQEAGFIHAVPRLAKASTTVYVDPMFTVS
jgi:hypothetical protein